MEVLKRYQDLRGKETRREDSEAVAGLFSKEGVEVAAGAVVNEEARVVGHIYARVERGEEGMVKRLEYVGLSFRVGELLGGEKVLVNHLESKVRAVIVAEAAEEDTAEITGANVAEELQVAEMKPAIRGESSSSLDGGPVRIRATVGTAGDGGGGGIGCICGCGG